MDRKISLLGLRRRCGRGLVAIEIIARDGSGLCVCLGVQRFWLTDFLELSILRQHVKIHDDEYADAVSNVL